MTSTTPTTITTKSALLRIFFINPLGQYSMLTWKNTNSFHELDADRVHDDLIC